MADDRAIVVQLGPDGRKRPAREDEQFESDPSIERAEIEVGLIHGGVEDIDYDAMLSNPEEGTHPGYPVDAVAVGHYIGVQPVAAELALDRSVSAALLGREDIPANDKADLLLTQYTERGTIHGKLGQPFILPDPRAARDRSPVQRVIAIAGMGEPGRFGAPELTVLARELSWALGRMNKRHLATVLIGAGAGNLSVREAVTAWMNGIRRALTGSRYDAGRRLLRVTFVEYDPLRIPEINRHLSAEADRQKRLGLEMDYRGPTAEELERIKQEWLERARERLPRDWERRKSDERPHATPTRVTLHLDPERKTYHFGAITDDASVPEREIRLDPNLVWQANDELAGESVSSMQRDRGRLLEELLIPDDLRRHLYNPAPLVMLVDATTARIHWEMVAQPELSPSPEDAAPAAPDAFDEQAFLGTSRGFTRQLRTTFAPPPEPPPPPRRVLRVLVVADPAEDARLKGAEEEGEAVADLFESYNSVYAGLREVTRVEVTLLSGPSQATRTNVLRELLVRPYDVLHYAGHCVYQLGGDPTLSGWIFHAGRKELLSANELNRVDRIPKFIFSNACESGVTPDRSAGAARRRKSPAEPALRRKTPAEREAALAPSFAEAFFQRGVANFVCTAWPVGDLAARVFAVTLYSALLGIEADDRGKARGPAPAGAKPMLESMREARLAIARTPDGRTTWGAYQHYGNPFFQFFYTREQDRAAKENAPKEAKENAPKDTGARPEPPAPKKGGAPAGPAGGSGRAPEAAARK
ncbi:MAG TPA: CHAT domain-containing protein [Pyrinomonadaceae bacterium]|nr:CHAT domain-containing protein [Pyrinomonadaceae bacterium]